METKSLRGRLLGLVLLGAVVGVCGCSRPAEKAVKKEPPKMGAPAAKQETPKDAKAAKKDELPGLAGLSEADRELAKKQRVCPVMDEVLGERGKPVKITIKEQVVFLCCPGCEQAIKKDPDKYLGKLKAAAAKK